MCFSQYVLQAAEAIKAEAYGDVNVEVELFHANSGVNTLAGGFYSAKTPVYADLKHVVMRLSPKSSADKLRAGDEDSAILVSAHIDTVFSAYVLSVLLDNITFDSIDDDQEHAE